MIATSTRALARCTLLAGLALGLCTQSATAYTANTSEKLVIEAGRIITQAGDDIENGLIVIEAGRITAIGAADEVEKPWDAPVIGGPEFTAFPGFVEAHAYRGLDRANENLDVAPFLSLRDSIDPVNFFFEDCLRSGITTINLQHAYNCVIGAQGMVVRPVGMTVEEMTVRPVHGLKLSARPKSGKSHATQAQVLRQAFEDLRLHLEELVREKQNGVDHARREALFQGRELEGEQAQGRPMEGSAWKVEGLELVPRGEIDEKLEPLLALVEGRMDAFFECGSARDVHLALEVARDNGFLERTTLVLAGNCYKAVDQVAEAGVPVVLAGSQVFVETDPVTGDETDVFIPGVFAERGVTFALSSRDATSNSLWFQAAMATGLGLGRAEALAAVTTVPAGLLGLGEDVGSLEVGKLGNLVLLSGDPLSVTSFVDKVVIEGRAVYDRATDLRSKHLIDAQEPGRAAAAEAAETEDEDDEAKKDSE